MSQSLRETQREGELQVEIQTCFFSGPVCTHAQTHSFTHNTHSLQGDATHMLLLCSVTFNTTGLYSRRHTITTDG